LIPDYLKIKNTSPMGGGRKNTKKNMISNLEKIRQKISLLDNQLQNNIAQFRAKYKKTPTEFDLMQDPDSMPLIDERKSLVAQYKQLQQQALYAQEMYETIQKADPIRSAQKSFSGIKMGNPFDTMVDYKDPVVIPALTPSRRIGQETYKVGTLWDPRFNMGDITVDPRVKRYYNSLTSQWKKKR
jgi:hypothetical protein